MDTELLLHTTALREDMQTQNIHNINQYISFNAKKLEARE
jgi:hypothetical protein